MRTVRSRPGRRGRRFPAVPSERGTRLDVLTAVVITVVLAVVAATVMLTGSAARSQLRAADAEQPVYGPAVQRPTALQPLWSHASAGTGAPLTTKGNLVTLDEDGTLVGRDAGSGEERWSYSHAGDFCAATFYADVLVAAFDGASGCSDVTALDPTTQEYSSTRQSAFPPTMRLQSTWKHSLASSPERLEIWRDDLVRTIEYGAVAAPQEADMQPRTGCVLGTADLTDERFAVAERCPGDDSARLTVSTTVPEDNRKPEEIASAPTGADGLWVIEVTEEGVLALQQRGVDWSVEWFTSPTEHSTVLRLPAEPPLMPSAESLSDDGGQARWFDGSATHAFDATTGTHSWTVPGTTGPGLGGGDSPDPGARTATDWVMVPVPGGFALLDRDSGSETLRLDAVPAEAGDDAGDQVGDEAGDEATGLAQIGDILYERRGGAIHAYKLLA